MHWEEITYGELFCLIMIWNVSTVPRQMKYILKSCILIIMGGLSKVISARIIRKRTQRNFIRNNSAVLMHFTSVLTTRFIYWARLDDFFSIYKCAGNHLQYLETNVLESNIVNLYRYLVYLVINSRDEQIIL